MKKSLIFLSLFISFNLAAMKTEFEKGLVDILRYFIQHYAIPGGFDNNMTHENLGNPLTQAIRNKDLIIAKALIAVGTDVNDPKCKSSPLKEASKLQSTELLEYLLNTKNIFKYIQKKTIITNIEKIKI